MRILMLGWELPPYINGGLGVACYHMSKALAINGSDIDFVVPYKAVHTNIDFMKIHNATSLSPEQRNGLGPYDSKLVSRHLSEADSKDLGDMRGVQKRYVEYVERLVKKVRPDVIHAHDWLTMEAGIRAKEVSGRPLVVHVHATEFDRSAGGRGNPLVREIELQGLMMADKIFAVSRHTKSVIIENYKIPEDKIMVVHNALDINDLTVDNDDESVYKYLESLRREGYTVISVITRFTIQKGLTFLVRALAKACSVYPKIVLLLAGDGEQKNELIELASELGIADKVFFAGFITGKPWRDTYKISDIFVMSSVSEPFGITALEAAYYGNALIITYQSGVGEVLQNIFRYDYWDEEKLANQIVGIASSETLRQTLSDNVKNEYKSISWHKAAASCLKGYNLTIGAENE